MRIARVFGKVHRGWSLSLAHQLLSLDPIWPGDELIGNWPAGKFWGRPHTPSRWIFYHSCQSNALTYTCIQIYHNDAFILCVFLCIIFYSWMSISPGHHVFPIILHELPIKCEKDFSSVTCGNYAARLEALSHRTYTKICKTGIAKNYISPLATCRHEDNMHRDCKVYQETDL